MENLEGVVTHREQGRAGRAQPAHRGLTVVYGFARLLGEKGLRQTTSHSASGKTAAGDGFRQIVMVRRCGADTPRWWRAGAPGELRTLAAECAGSGAGGR